MEFSVNPPYELGQLSCVINAIIDVKNITVKKLTSASMSEVNTTLMNIGYGYLPTNSLGNMWIQTVAILDKISKNEREKKLILNLAQQKYEVLKSAQILN